MADAFHSPLGARERAFEAALDGVQVAAEAPGISPDADIAQRTMRAPNNGAAQQWVARQQASQEEDTEIHAAENQDDDEEHDEEEEEVTEVVKLYNLQFLYAFFLLSLFCVSDFVVVLLCVVS